MPTPIYPSWNDKEYDLLKKMTENTALIADYEIGDVASVAGTANQVLVNGGTSAATGNITLSLPSTLIAPGNLTVSGAAATMDSTAAGVGFRGTSGGHNRFSLIRDDTLYPGSVLLSAFGEVDLMYNATTTATSGTVGARLTASGNFMIGSTGADGGQKLQVSGSAKIAGPTTIGAANGLTYLDLTNSGDSTTLELENNTSGHIIVGTGSKSLLLKTNSTTALTLDSSQNTILAGLAVLNESKSIRWTSGGTVGGTKRAQITADSSYLTLDSQTSNPILLQCNSATVLTLEPTNSKATFAGRIKAAGLPTSNVGLDAGELWVDTAAGNVVKRN